MIRVLVVDDSVVMRTQISASLKGIDGIEVVGSAANGRIALQMIVQNSIDLIILDLEMPDLDGIGTLKEIRRQNLKVKSIVFSGITIRSAELALEALREGAHDVVAKPSMSPGADLAEIQAGIGKVLGPKIKQFWMSTSSDQKSVAPSLSKVVPMVSSPTKRDIATLDPSAIVIASSTGGPNALEAIFSHLRQPIKKPILIVQHMPPVFTQILAKRLSDLFGLNIKEAVNGEALEPGVIRVCPGGYHMVLHRSGGGIFIQLNQEPQRNSVRPAADYLFESAARVFGKSLLGIVLTGMGEDGAVGASAIKEVGGGVVIQNRDSCIVFGMPGAVAARGDADLELGLEEIANLIVKKGY